MTRPGYHHERVKSFFGSLRATDALLTTWPVLTECGSILRRTEATYSDWLLESEVQVVDFGLQDLQEMRVWRARYSDREVDFADQTLVWLADSRKTNLIATTDFDESRHTGLRTQRHSKFSLLALEPGKGSAETLFPHPCVTT